MEEVIEGSLQENQDSVNGKSLMQKIITIDPDHCTGCRSCEMVCSLGHDRIWSPLLSRITISQWREISANVPIVCQHCEISRP